MGVVKGFSDNMNVKSIKYFKKKLQKFRESLRPTSDMADLHLQFDPKADRSLKDQEVILLNISRSTDQIKPKM